MRRRPFVPVLLVVSSVLLALGGFGVPSSLADGAPTLSVTPTKNLIDPLGDGAFVRAAWTNMPPNGSVYLRQCTQHPKDVKDDCSQTGPYLGPGLITAGSSLDDGTGSWNFAVRIGLVNSTLLDEPTKISFPCDYRHPCTIVLFTDANARDLTTAVKVPITFAFPPSACPVSASPYVQGGGSAPVFNAMLMWAAKACKPPLSVQNQYVLDSGPAGRAGFVGGLLDYAVTGQPLTAKQSEDLDAASMRYAYAPLTASAQVFGIRLFDRITRQQIRDIRLTPELLAEMFTGQLTNWNDPRILALNPGHVDPDGNGTLPTKLKAVVRGDASDSSFELTSYFWATARQTYIDGGKDLVGGNPFEKGPTEIFPSTGQILLFQGERTVAREVARPSQDTTPDFGYIGAMDASWAAQYGLATVKIENESGNFVDATPAAIAGGLDAMTEGDDGFLEPDFNAPGAGVYPLPTVEYALVRHDVGGSFDGNDGLSLKTFLSYAVTDGQVGLPAGYIALPDGLVQQTQQAIKAIPDDPTDLGDGDDPPGSVGFGPDVPPATDGFTTGDDLTAGDESSVDPGLVGSIQRGPVVAAVPLAAVVGRLALPILVIAGTVGLLLGLGMLGTDRRAAKRGDDPTEPEPRKRRFRKDRVPG